MQHIITYSDKLRLHLQHGICLLLQITNVRLHLRLSQRWLRRILSSATRSYIRSILRLADCLPGLLFNPKKGSITFSRNIGEYHITWCHIPEDIVLLNATVVRTSDFKVDLFPSQGGVGYIPLSWSRNRDYLCDGTPLSSRDLSRPGFRKLEF
jgi:hypothetical protein